MKKLKPKEYESLLAWAENEIAEWQNFIKILKRYENTQTKSMEKSPSRKRLGRKV